MKLKDFAKDLLAYCENNPEQGDKELMATDIEGDFLYVGGFDIEVFGVSSHNKSKRPIVYDLELGLDNPEDLIEVVLVNTY